MSCYLLASARTVLIQLQMLQTSPGGEDITVSFRPNRSDDLHTSAKESARLAYRILFREGIVRSQLVARCQVSQAPTNVVGRSADLAFALAIVLQAYREGGRRIASSHTFHAIAATGVLDPDGTVRAVEHVPGKLRAALRELGSESVTVFFPSENAADVDLDALAQQYPNQRVVPIGHLHEALEHLGIVLERVYLRNPFRGLQYFDYEHHSIFFGRGSEVHAFVKQLLRRERAGAPGILVEGPSGSGKSSFLRAGVLPTLVNPRHEPKETQEAILKRPVNAAVRHAIWRPGLMQPSIDESGIVRSIRECWAAFSALELRGDPIKTLADLAKHRQAAWPATQRFVWAIDQLEEILNLGLAESVLESLGRFLAELQSDGVWTLASVRADAMPQLKRHELLRAVFGADEGQYYLATLRGVAFDDVISLPAKAADLTFDEAPDGKLLDQLLRDEAYLEQDSLPLLQFTLSELYVRRSGNVLTYAAYEKLGGLSGSVATIAGSILAAEASESPRAVPRLFRNLIGVDEMGRATRRYAPMAEIAVDARQKNLVLRLVEARLCVTNEREGESVVAFAHDSLLRTFPVVTEWLKEEGALLQTRELAQREMRLWQQHGESASWLAAADKVAGFKTLEAAEITLPPAVRDFIDRSQRQVRRTTRIKQTAVGLIAVLAVAASIGAWIATRKEREAEYQTAEARKAQLQLLTEAAAERLKDGDLIFARGIVLEVLKRRPASVAPDPAAVNVLQEIRAADPARTIMTGHTAAVRRVAYSPDGSRIITASHDGTARIWDTRTGIELQVLHVHPHIANTPVYSDIVKTAVYSLDGKRVLTASGDKTQVWDVRTGAQVMVLAGHHEDLESAAYSPDGTRIIAAFRTGCESYDARTGAHLTDFVRPGGDFQSAVFSPDGSRVVTAGGDGTARIWDAQTGRELTALIGHLADVQSASYSPDGRRIVTASRDKTIRIWDAQSGNSLMVLSGHFGQVWFATYSPDGKTIASAATDKTARIWDAATGASLRILSGHVEVVGSVAYSPDGRQIVTGGWDFTARTWDLHQGTEAVVISGHKNKVTSVTLSPDGLSLVTASDDGTARIWDAQAGTPIAQLSDAGDILDTSYSGDGLRILATSRNKGMRIWDAHTGARVLSVPDPDDVVSAVYSPDGTRILAIFGDFRFGTRDVKSGAWIKRSEAVHRDFITSAVYSPDATRILTASVDKTVRIWDANTFAQLAILPHKDLVYQASYSPDGKLIVTAANDSLAHVWDAHTGTEIRALVGHHATVAVAMFSPDGSRIITVSREETVRIWDTHSGVELAVLPDLGGQLGDISYLPSGIRVASVWADNTVRISNAALPADWLPQFLWEQAVEADPLSNVQRTVLGIPSTLALLANGALQASGPNGNRPSIAVNKALLCSERAGAYYDPDRLTPGLEQQFIIADIAIPSCTQETAVAGSSGRVIYQAGRALLARGDQTGARRDFEIAISKGYRAAFVDLGLLLSDPAADMLDPIRALSLFEQAWRSGVTIAGFRLAAIYEHGVHANDPRVAFQPDARKAWLWYQEAAKHHEPYSLARLAERAEHDAIASASSKTDALLLEAFTLYARAAERARVQAWPDSAWRGWRYRRASLARVLAADGRMLEVARAYKSVLDETPL
jgi:WD40 repeat protein